MPQPDVRKANIVSISGSGGLFEQARQQAMSQRAGVIHARTVRKSRGQQHRVRGRSCGFFSRHWWRAFLVYMNFISFVPPAEGKGTAY